MRTRPLLLSPAIALSLLAAACGRLTGTGDGGGIDHPTGRNDVILRVDYGGGFVPAEYSVRSLPTFALYGDGTLVLQGPQIEIYPGPATPNLLRRTIDEDGIQAILEAAQEAGLLGPDRHYDYPCVADGATTTFTLNADGATHTISAYSLFEGEGDCPDVDRQGRAKLAGFMTKLGDLGTLVPEGSLGPEEPFVESELRVYARPYGQAPDPQLEQRVSDWPLATGLGGFGEEVADLGLRCGVVSGADLKLLRPLALEANELTPWRSGGERYLLIFRPLLPDEHGC